MRISNINPEYLKDEDRVKLLNGEVVPFLKGKVRLAKEEEIALVESTHHQKMERSDTYIPIVWIE